MPGFFFAYSILDKNDLSIQRVCDNICICKKVTKRPEGRGDEHVRKNSEATAARG